MKLARPPLALAILILSATSSVAQTRFELNPFYGLRAGGSFRAVERELALDIERSGGYGLAFGVDLTENMQVEFLWSRQKSTLEAISLVPGVTPDAEQVPAFDVGVDFYQGAFVYGGGPRAFRPYVAVGAGVGVFDPDAPGGSTLSRFAFSLGTGFKSFFNERFGIRFDARAFGTRIGDSGEDVACDPLGCVSFESAATFWQGQLVGGLILAF